MEMDGMERLRDTMLLCFNFCTSAAESINLYCALQYNTTDFSVRSITLVGVLAYSKLALLDYDHSQSYAVFLSKYGKHRF